MGLGFDNIDAHFSYSGFRTFREKIAETVGLNYKNFREMCESGNNIKWLLIHSDCDGSLTVCEMKKIIPELEKVLKSWKEDTPYRQEGFNLLIGMKQCVLENKEVRFI